MLQEEKLPPQVFFQPTTLDHFLSHLADRENFNAGEGGTKQGSEMSPVACQQDISATTDCGSKNRLIFGRKRSFRAGSDAW
jgi:hypothetical protein